LRTTLPHLISSRSGSCVYAHNVSVLTCDLVKLWRLHLYLTLAAARQSHTNTFKPAATTDNDFSQVILF